MEYCDEFQRGKCAKGIGIRVLVCNRSLGFMCVEFENKKFTTIEIRIVLILVSLW